MPYIASDGSIHENQPWGLGKIVGYFWSTVDFIVAFFQTMIPGLNNNGPSQISYGGNTRSTPRNPPRRNVRGFSSLSDIQPPPCVGSS